MSQLIVSSDTLSSRGNNVLDTNGFKQGDTLLLDFFAGAGGATQGFVLAGFKPALIVEASKTKRDQYQRNFGKVRKIKVFERNGDYFVYGNTAEGDASIIIATLKRMLGNKYRRVKYHVHASPSCVEWCPVGRIKKKKKSNKKSLSNSLGTFTWTCKVIKKLKEEFKDKMTWSIEDAAQLGASKRKWKNLRKMLPKDNIWNVWDFTLWGVPQDRKRFIALDNSLNISNLPPPVNQQAIKGAPYVASLLQHLNLDETKNDPRKYSQKDMKGRIGMDTAFRLYGCEFPDNVTSMGGQGSGDASITKYVRQHNQKRLQLRDKVKELEKRNHADQFAAKREYAKYYYDLTKLAYRNLVEFIQTCDDKTLDTFYQDEEIINYIKKSHMWLQNVAEWEVDDYVDACVKAYSENYIDYAFATTKKNRTAHSNILLQDVLTNWRSWGKLKKILKSRIQKIVNVNPYAKVADLRDYFGLKIARFYNTETDTYNYDAEPNRTETRPLWAPAFTIQAKSWKNWFKPLGRNSKWFSTGMKFSFLKADHYKALGTFPKSYDFGTDELKDIRYAVGDSVPPLVTVQLGLAIRNETIQPEIALQTLYDFTPATNLMADLYIEFKKYCKTQNVRESGFLQYISVIRNHFEKNEFLSEKMLIDWVWEPRKTDASNGFVQAAAVKWIGMLEKLQNDNFFTDRRIKDHIRQTGMWRNIRKYARENMWLHPDRHTDIKIKEKWEEKRKQFMDKIDAYKKTLKKKKNPSLMRAVERNVSALYTGWVVMGEILKNVIKLMSAVKEEEKEKEEQQAKKAQRYFDLTIEDEVIDLTIENTGFNTVQFKYKLKF